MQEAIAQHSVESGRPPEKRLTLTLAPHLFVRTSGLPSDYSMLSDRSASEALALVRSAEVEMKKAVDRACARLEAMVPEGFEAGPQIGRGLISLKRDLFNHRGIARESHRTAVDWLGGQERAIILTARQAIDAFDTAQSRFRDAHQREERQTRNAALDGTNSELFASGLAVINPALYDHLESARAGQKLLSDKDYNQLTATAMRYLLRVSRKTSPIATFGPVWAAKWGKSFDTWQSVGVPENIRCVRRVRGALLQRLMQHLLKNWHNLADDAPIALNRTLRANPEGRWEWWVRRFDEAPNAILAGSGLDRVSGRSKAITAIITLFQAQPNGSITVDELRKRIRGKGGGHAKFERVDKVLASAWQSQLLLPVLNEHQNALVWADEVTSLLGEEQAKMIKSQINALARLSEGEDLPSRELVHSYENSFDELSETIGESVHAALRPIITVDAHAGSVDRAHPQLPDDLIAVLASLTRSMPALAAETPSAQMLVALRRFFDRRNAAAATQREKLSEFIQAYFDEGGETQSKILHRSIRSPSSSEKAHPDPVDSASDALLDRLARDAQSLNEITLSSSDIDDLALKSAQPGSDYLSLQFHLQSIDSGKRFVLNQIFPGSCSTLTRFLPSETIRKQRAYLRKTIGPRIQVGINAAFGFNASSHPHLIDRELSLPPLPGTGDLEAVDMQSLWIERGARDSELQITDGEGQVYAPIFLSALNPMSLPKQYQVLHALCVNHWRHSGLSSSIIRRAMNGFEDFRALARISIDNVVVLRRSWMVSPEGLPNLSLGAADFFQALNIWADERGLPAHLFYQANVFPLGSRQPGGSAAKPRRPRLYKPMPLDRDCALGVELFRQAAKKSSLGLLLSEALPSPYDASYIRNGKPVAAELAVEITCDQFADD